MAYPLEQERAASLAVASEHVVIISEAPTSPTSPPSLASQSFSLIIER